MAWAARDRDRRGGTNNGPHSQDIGTVGKRLGRRPMDKTVNEATKAHMKDTNEGIRKIIEEMEDRVKEEESEEEMEEWRDPIPHPVNTRGRMSQYK